MSGIEFEVNGLAVSLGCVWVHMQDVAVDERFEYRVRVLNALIDEVFDADDKGALISWDTYLREEVAELGTFMISIYFQKMSKIAGANEEPYRWVIATLDSVVETESYLELRGRTLRFDAEKFLR